MHGENVQRPPARVNIVGDSRGAKGTVEDRLAGRRDAFDDLPGNFQAFDHDEIAGILAKRGGGSRYLVQVWSWYRARAHWDGRTHERGVNWTSATRERCALDCGISVRTVSRARKLLSDAGLLFAQLDHWGHTHTWIGPWRPDPAVSSRKQRKDSSVSTCIDPDLDHGINGRAAEPATPAAVNPTRPGFVPGPTADESPKKPTLDSESVELEHALEELEHKWPAHGQGDAQYTKWTYSRGNARAALRAALAVTLWADLYADARNYLDEPGRLYCVPLDTWLRFTRPRYKARNPAAFPPGEARKRIDEADRRIKARRARQRRERREVQRSEEAWAAMVERPGDARLIAGRMVRQIEADQRRAARPPPPPPPPSVAELVSRPARPRRPDPLAKTVRSGCLDLLAMVCEGKITAAQAEAWADELHEHGGLVSELG